MGWLGGAILLCKLQVPGRPTIWMLVVQGPIALAVDAGGGLFGTNLLHATCIYVLTCLRTNLQELTFYHYFLAFLARLNEVQKG